jgi:hypothetical protein
MDDVPQDRNDPTAADRFAEAPSHMHKAQHTGPIISKLFFIM